MLRSTFARADVAMRAAAATAVFAFGAASAAQAAVSIRPHTANAFRAASPNAVEKLPNAGGTFTTLDDKADPTFNQLLGINNEGVISGYYGSGAKGHPNIGYTIDPPYTQFFSDNLPGSVQTQATGVSNKGYSTGFWSPTNTGSDANFGFIRLKNVLGSNTIFWLSVNPAFNGASPFVNQVLGVNDSGNAVGFYNDAAGNSHAYAYELSTGTFSPITVATATSAAATGINSNNVVCGLYVNPNGTTKGFLEGVGVDVHFGVTGSTTTQFLGVNASGEAVGFYTDAAGTDHGLIYHQTTGVAEAVNDPKGAQGTVLNGINDKGEIVGFYTDAAGNTHGMIVQGAK